MSFRTQFSTHYCLFLCPVGLLLPAAAIAGDLHARLLVRYDCGSATVTVEHDVREGNTYEYAWSTDTRGGATITVRRGEASRICVEVFCSCNGMRIAKADPCVDLAWPNEETFGIETTPSSCGGSDGTAMLTNGAAISSIRWSLSGASSEPRITGLRAGSYSADVVDVHGCDHHLDFVIDGPEKMDFTGITAEPSPVDCRGGGGRVAFTVTASDPVIITYDGNEGTSFTGLSSGEHTFEIQRADGSACGSMVVSVPEAPRPDIQYEAVAPSCVPGGDGQLRLITDGEIKWLNPAGRTGDALDGLAPGNYSAWVISPDGKTCGEVPVIVPEPIRPQIYVTTTPTSCSYTTDGSVVLAAATVWPPVELGSMDRVFSGLGSGQEVQIQDLPPGTYNVSAFDSAGCAASATFTITTPPPLWIQLEKGNCRCAGDSSARLAATGGGGTPGYSWQWKKETNVLSEEAVLASANAGVYTVELRDSHSCLATMTDTITEPPPMKHNKKHATRTRLWFVTSIEIHGGKAPYRVSIVRTNDGEESEEETDRRTFLGTKRLRLMIRDSLGCEHLATLDTKEGRVRTALPNIKRSKDRVKACTTRWLFGIIPIRPKYCRD